MTRRKYGLRTYLRLTTIVAIFALMNFAFGKFAELFYGNFNALALYEDFTFFLLTVFIFAIMLWWADTRGTIARIMGAKEETPEKAPKA